MSQQVSHICVLGAPGSGKTTFCNQLSTALRMRHVQMDSLYYDFYGKTNRKPTDHEWVSLVNDEIKRGCLVTDGYYHPTVEARISNADIVVYFDISPNKSLFNAVTRAYMNMFTRTTAHPKTRQTLATKLRYLFNFRLYLKILQFRRKNSGNIKRFSYMNKKLVFIHIKHMSQVKLVLEDFIKNSSE